MQIKKAVCMWCHAHCRVAVHVEGDHLVKLEPDEDFPSADLYAPITRACPRRKAAKEWFYHPDRLNYPLKRTGKRGDNSWEKISWEQALEEIGRSLSELVDKFGGKTIASARGTGRTCDEYRSRFLNLVGGNLIGATTICYGPTLAVSNAMIGWMPWPFARPGLTKAILLIGVNEHSYPPTIRSFERAQGKGAKLIVVDPRRTRLAGKADLFLQVQPGTDLALLLAILHVIVTERLYDEEFVTKWCYGFDLLVDHVKPYTPEWAAAVTGVEAAKIREAAKIYATAKPAVTFSGEAIDHGSAAVQTLRARFMLPAITGNLDIPGGDYIPGPYKNARLEQEEERAEIIPPEKKAMQIGADKYKLLSWTGYDTIQETVKEVWGKAGAASVDSNLAHAPSVYRAMVDEKPYPIKAFFTVSSNPLLTMTNVKLVYQALKKVDLHVAMDFFLTPTAMLADYVLPAASWLERPYLWNGYGISGFLVASEQALPSSIPGSYDRRNDYDFWREMGIRVGQAKYWPAESLEDAYDLRLKGLGVTFKQFMQEKSFDFQKATYQDYKQMGFATPTRKVELYSTVFEKMGFAPLPVYHEPPESHDAKAEPDINFPLVLISGGRFMPFYHSEHRQLPSLRKLHPDPLVEINPETAEKYGIKGGDWVAIETKLGRIVQKCSLKEGLLPDVVHAQHGWWFPEYDLKEPSLGGLWQSNVNVLIDNDDRVCDPLSGGWPRSTLCRIEPANVERECPE
ncbi:MAG: molybdopterin-dependent oxidoreductase [Bacillota bacterium]